MTKETVEPQCSPWWVTSDKYFKALLVLDQHEDCCRAKTSAVKAIFSDSDPSERTFQHVAMWAGQLFSLFNDECIGVPTADIEPPRTRPGKGCVKHFMDEWQHIIFDEMLLIICLRQRNVPFQSLHLSLFPTGPNVFKYDSCIRSFVHILFCSVNSLHVCF